MDYVWSVLYMVLSPTININRFVIHRCEFYLSKLKSSVHLFHDWTWNGIMFMNHNRLITPQKKFQKRAGVDRSFEKNTPQWNPPSKTWKGADQTLKTSSCEISFWVLRCISVAIVTFREKISKMKMWYKTFFGPSKTRKGADQKLKTSSCEISFWVLRCISLAIVTLREKISKMKMWYKTFFGENFILRKKCIS